MDDRDKQPPGSPILLNILAVICIIGFLTVGIWGWVSLYHYAIAFLKGTP